MLKKGMVLLILAGFPFAASFGTESVAHKKNRLAVGINNVGGQVLFHFNPPFALEARYTTGKDETDTKKEVTSDVFGLRTYWFFGRGRAIQFYTGLEGAVIQIDVENTTLDTSGLAAGGFLGLQYRFGRRWTFGFDMGPYYVGLEEDKTGLDDSSVEIVGNAFINFYLF